MDRMAENKMIAYVQPIFLDYDMHIVESRIGYEKSLTTYNFKTMLDKGIRVSGGSDAPVVHFNIFENLYSAVSRRDLKGNPLGGWLPNQKLTMVEALRLFTIEGAYASGEESLKGTLEIGKLADFAVIDTDLLKVQEDDILKARVTRTVLGGQTVFKA